MASSPCSGENGLLDRRSLLVDEQRAGAVQFHADQVHRPGCGGEGPDEDSSPQLRHPHHLTRAGRFITAVHPR